MRAQTLTNDTTFKNTRDKESLKPELRTLKTRIREYLTAYGYVSANKLVKDESLAVPLRIFILYPLHGPLPMRAIRESAFVVQVNLVRIV